VSLYLFMRLDFASGINLGPSRTTILEGIDRLGSISAAARAVGLTYRQVWSVVQLLNKIFPQPLVSIRAGGRLSGASLTPLGKKLVARFRAMEADAQRALKPHFSAFERMLGENPRVPAPIPSWARLTDAPSAAAAKARPARRRRARR